MEQKQLAAFRRRLEEEKKQLEERVRSFTEEGLGLSMSDSLGELSLYDNDPADVGTELFERSKDFALRETAKLRIRAIDEALAKIADGTYGTCEFCGTPIPLERLAAVPATTTCVKCRRKAEESPDQSTRPVEEEVVEEIYHQTFDEAIGNVEYDLEDAWQELARFGEHAEQTDAGAYYGEGELAEEDRGYVEEVENIPYEVGDDGVIYQNFRGFDNESAPREKIDVGPGEDGR
ncbi:MAG: TraR/DksA C4-type zinc finger protein [Desulfotomaculales bacterium]